MILGSRGSALALWQSNDVAARLKQHGVDASIKVITTAGDKSLAERLVGSLEKGFFTAELETELTARSIDAAVHSLKDLPTRLPSGLAVGAILPRANAFDLLITHPRFVDEHARLPLKAGTSVGASSLRRDAMVKHFGPQSRPVPLRGNVPTRIEKLRRGDVDAIVLAAAGVQRLALDLSGLVAFQLNPHRFVPAPGQGAVAVETRANDDRFAPLDHATTRRAVDLERALLRGLEGGCTTPFGAYLDGRQLILGQATPEGWRSLSLDVGSSAPDDAFVADALTRLAAAKGSLDDDWLVRPL